MELIPAVDVLDGRCVRLYQGDYARETVYSDDPTETAARWASLGVKRLHIVDLDGARAGAPANLDVVRQIVNTVPVPVQLGGGMRSAAAAREALALGVDRVIFGTVAIEAPEIVETVCRTEGASSVVVSVDARDGHVAVRGWTEGAGVLVSDLVRRMADGGVERVMYTDIARDGGAHGKGAVTAELDIRPDLWFFGCHFENDPVMPGCLGVDALWQLAGFHLGWLGHPGRGRALGVGEVKFADQVLPSASMVTYRIDFRRVIARKLVLGQADGQLLADGNVIYEARDLRVGLFTG